MERMEPPPHWEYQGDHIVREVVLPRYAMVLALVGFVAAIAIVMDHHPQVTFGYQHVTIELTSHDAGGVTERDVAFASLVEAALGCALA